MSILGILIAVLVLCVIVWAARALMAAFGVGDPIRTVVMVVLVLICLFWILGALGVDSPIRLR
jgi:hypothetical protein